MMHQKLVDILACPLCSSRLLYDEKQQELVCQVDRLAFQIQAGIPIMLVAEARPLTQGE